MTRTLVHRGPDEEGLLFRPFAGMGMRRLSIIDVAGGQQPMCNETGDVSVVFNGEIYNYDQLRRQLLQDGHTLHTRSDTETIVHLYEQYGSDCVNHLDGMFAFAVYDERSMEGAPRLLLARDRLGKKPLYYSDTQGALIFGSELKPLLVDDRISRELDPEALHHFLSLLMVPSPLSIFRSVRKLSPGHLLECDATGPRIRCYWQYPAYTPAPEIRAEEIGDRIRDLLFQAVQKRLISEVPLGAFLSGGLDSSTVVAIMSRLTGKPVETFSIGFEGPERNNELPYARQIANHYNCNHHEFLVKPDIVETIQEVVHFADEPFAISSAIPTLLIAKAARKSVTVVLTGDGGDEIFGGYEGYLYEYWAELYRRLPSLADRALIGAASLLPATVNGPAGNWRNRVVRFVSNAREDVGKRRLGWASGFSEEAKHRLYDVSRGAASDRPSPTFAFIDTIAAISEGEEPAARQNDLDIRIWLPDEMLAKVDRMTMAASIEARCPLLDWHLVEFMAKLPFRTKVPGIRQSSLKLLLRRAVRDLIPPRLLNRRKQGFNVPLDQWFRGGARTFLESVLSPSRLKRFEIFDSNEVQTLLQEHMAGHIKANNRLYALLVFQIWAEAYL